MSEVIFEEFKGHSTFQEVENRMLRAYNQYNVLSNMAREGLNDLGVEYLNSLPEPDRIGLSVITTYINMKGIEETKREIISSGMVA